MIPIQTPQLQRIHLPLFVERGVDVAVLRLDQIHPVIHGNKWFKLKHNLARIDALGKKRVLSFGGAYSNHLYALAAAGNAFGFETIGIVRGELIKPLNKVLTFAESQGMRLEPISRAQYREKDSVEFIAELRHRFGDIEILPEGGSNGLAVQGCEEIASFLDWGFFDVDDGAHEGERVVAVSCGTAATLAGIVLGLEAQYRAGDSPRVVGVSVLKAEGYLVREAESWIRPRHAAVRWSIDERYHFGGYARRTPALEEFMTSFSQSTGVPVEPVYTGKLFYALYDQISRGEYAPGTQIIAVHTGGIYS